MPKPTTKKELLEEILDERNKLENTDRILIG